MLVHLTIRNYALISHLEIDPSAGLNVITGETGAGKSILLGAIGLLLGNRADTKVLWDANEKCVAEGTFDIRAYDLQEVFETENLDYDPQTVIRREIASSGKSRAFINDTPVTLEVLRTIGSRLMDVHSQHETLELGNRRFQLRLVDTFADNGKVRNDYAGAWKEYVTARNAYDSLLRESVGLKQESDFIRFQLDELNKASFTPGEQEDLESQLRIMEHAEDIKTRLNGALSRLNGTELSAINTLSEVRSQLSPITSYSEKYQKLFERLESARIELSDLIGELEHEEEKIEFDPDRATSIQERLSLMYTLLKKHQAPTLTALESIRQSLEDKSMKAGNVDGLLANAKAALDSAASTLEKRATALSKSRQKVFEPLCKQLVVLLKQLGIPDARLVLERESIEPGATGVDSIDILFSANKGISPRPLAQVASGGEFSRLMFCVKYVMAEKSALPTLILDEIDTGVSGQIAIQLVTLMSSFAAKHQIIAISHLPQIAARGDSHYFVYKDNSAKRTTTHIRKLEATERVTEIAKMIGGAKPSTLAIENARELMEG